MKPTASSCCEVREGACAQTRPVLSRRGAGFQLEPGEQKLLALFLCLLIIPVLYVLRFLDDNTLTSWKWVFGSTRFGPAYLAVITAVLVAYPLSLRIRVEEWGRYAVPILPAVLVLALRDIPELMLDASRYFLQAKYLAVYGPGPFLRDWGHSVEAWTDLPAVPFIYGMVFRTMGEDRLWIQIANSLVMGGSAWLVYRLGRRLWTVEAGTYAGLLVSAMPFLLLQGPLMMVDIYAMFFLLLALYLFEGTLRVPGRFRVLAGSCAVALMLLSKYSMALMLPVLLLLWLGRRDRVMPGGFLRGFLMILSGLLLTALFIAFKWDVVRPQLMLLRDFQWSGLGRWKESHVSTFLFQIHPLIVPLALFGMFGAMKERDGRLLFAAWIPVMAYGLGVERSRYLLPLFPLLALAAGYGISRFRDVGLKRMMAFSITGTACVLLVTAYQPFVNGDSASNLRDAARYLDGLPSSRIYVYALPQSESSGNTTASVALLDLFSVKELRLMAGGGGAGDDESRFRLSPLRFTWRLDHPLFYRSAGELPAGGPVAVVSDQTLEEALPELAKQLSPRTLTRQFLRQSTPFRYKTLVTVFE